MDLLKDKTITDLSKREITKIKKEFNSKYAQKPVFEDRRFHESNTENQFDKFIERNEFSHDRDRIIFSKAFRRLEHKAQIYSFEKGDHFRTRLTHTLEVVQIARSIARNLGLNEDLTEAIALGHDIGHTPFGHQGEYVLDEIMRGNDDLGGKITYKMDYGGFKHNFNSLRVLDIIETKFDKLNGLNLTWQVLDGILKHTKIVKDGKKWDVKRFIDPKDYLEDIINLEFSATLEGQIVDIADEIAQRQHDLDDGLRDKDLRLDVEKIIGYINSEIEKIVRENSQAISYIFTKELLEKYVGKELKSIHFPNLGHFKLSGTNIISKIDIKDIISFKKTPSFFIKANMFNKFFAESEASIILLENLKSKLETKKITETIIEDAKHAKEKEDAWNSLIRNIIDYFIRDVTLASFVSITEQATRVLNYSNGKKIFTTKLIKFSNAGRDLNDEIEDYIENQIVNSFNVNRFDGKAEYILRNLFKAYYENPRQMPKEVLDRLSNQIKEVCYIYNCEIFFEKKPFWEFNFRDSSPKILNELIRLLKLDYDLFEINNIDKSIDGSKLILNLDENLLWSLVSFTKRGNLNYNGFDNEKWLMGNILLKINSIEKEDVLKSNKQIRFLKCLNEINYCYISLICDYIAGMTDNYAKMEYDKLYLV